MSAVLQEAPLVEENWRPAPGFPKYAISDAGRVQNIQSGKILGGNVSMGCVRVVLSIEGAAGDIEFAIDAAGKGLHLIELQCAHRFGRRRELLDLPFG